MKLKSLNFSTKSTGNFLFYQFQIPIHFNIFLSLARIKVQTQQNKFVQKAKAKRREKMRKLIKILRNK